MAKFANAKNRWLAYNFNMVFEERGTVAKSHPEVVDTFGVCNGKIINT